MFQLGRGAISRSDFTKVRSLYPFNYPRKGQVWTVRGMTDHPGRDDQVILHFDECDIGLCSSNFIPAEEGGGMMYYDIMQEIGERRETM